MRGYRVPVKACECKPHNKTYQRNHPAIVGPGFSRRKKRRSNYVERNFIDGQAD